jgi:hypothetical protein
MRQRSRSVGLVIILVLLPAMLLAVDEASFRIRSLGSELGWIVDDTYTDILANPGAILDLESSLLVTNLSNLARDDRALLGETQYESEYGSYLVGGFLRRDDWRFGLLAEYWRDKSWQTRARRMSPDFSSNYQFNWWYSSDAEVGTWITDHDANTETASDDYRTVERVVGTADVADREGIDLHVMVGVGSMALAYRLEHETGPVAYQPDYESRYLHEYELMEVGAQSLYEAVYASQIETVDATGSQTLHRLSSALAFGDEEAGLDVVLSLLYSDTEERYAHRQSKTIDFDPDNDGLPHESYYYERFYHQYEYQRLDEYETNHSGPGFGLDARYSRVLSDVTTLRLVGRFEHLETTDDDFASRDAHLESMTVFDGGTAFDSESSRSLVGENERQTTRILGGVGAVFRPEPRLLIGAAVKWYRDHREDRIHATYEQDAGPEPYESDARWTTERLVLPVGIEYRVSDVLAARLGTVTTFLSDEREERRTGRDVNDQLGGNEDATVDLRRESHASRTITDYSYGIGVKASEQLQIDIAAISDLTRLSTFLLSCMLSF